MADADRAQEAFDHLQVAALEVIAAFRAVLDLAEEAVREPQALRDLVTATARAATQAAANAAATQQPGGPGARPMTEEEPGRRHDAGVEHISIT